MIKIIFDGMCEGCEYADLTSEVYELQRGNEMIHEVVCKHEEPCMRIWQKFKVAEILEKQKKEARS